MRKLSWVIDIAGRGARGIGKMTQSAAFNPVLWQGSAYMEANDIQEA